MPELLQTCAGFRRHRDNGGLLPKLQSLANPPEGNSTPIPGEPVRLRGYDDELAAKTAQIFKSLTVEICSPDFGIHQQHHQGFLEGRSTIGIDELRPSLSIPLPGLGVAVSRKIDKVDPAIDQEVVDGSRPARSLGDPSQPFPAQQTIQKAGLAYIRPSREGDLGLPVLQKLALRQRRQNKLSSINLHGNSDSAAPPAVKA